MSISSKVLLEFAKDLHRVVEDFEEEMEILADKEIMDELARNEKAIKEGSSKTFNSLEELKDELDL